MNEIKHKRQEKWCSENYENVIVAGHFNFIFILPVPLHQFIPEKIYELDALDYKNQLHNIQEEVKYERRRRLEKDGFVGVDDKTN